MAKSVSEGNQIMVGICVIGLGRIGLPTALVLASKGNFVYGVDINKEQIEELNKGRIRFLEPGLRKLQRACGSRFRATTDLQDAVKRSSVILTCVGTRKYAKKNRPNLRVLYKIFRDLTNLDIRDKLIVLKTTVPIGTTRHLAMYLQTSTGLKADRDFFMAFSPERTVEGKAVVELQTLPVIVGAVGERSLKRAIEFYRAMGNEVVNVGKAEAAEFVKLIDNTNRITRFAFANDISLIAERAGLNAYDLIDAANYRYPRNNIAYPSCGVSGYCLTKDPYYLEDAFRSIRKDRGFPSLWITARRSYDFRGKSLVKQILHYLKRQGLTPVDTRVLVCGIAYKSNIDDVRDSHGVQIAEELARRGVQVSVWDPWIVGDSHRFPLYKEPTSAFRGKDAAIFTVAHKQFLQVAGKINRFTKLMRTPLIYDGAGLFRSRYSRSGSFRLIGTGLPDISEDEKRPR